VINGERIIITLRGISRRLKMVYGDLRIMDFGRLRQVYPEAVLRVLLASSKLRSRVRKQKEKKSCSTCKYTYYFSIILVVYYEFFSNRNTARTRFSSADNESFFSYSVELCYLYYEICRTFGRVRSRLGTVVKKKKKRRLFICFSFCLSSRSLPER